MLSTFETLSFKKSIDDFYAGKIGADGIRFIQPPDIEERTYQLQLQVSSLRSKPLLALKAIYNYWDKSNAFYRPAVTCKKGCAHCCKRDVHIFPLEAAHIQQETRHTIKRRPTKIQVGFDTDCPFLVDESCSIYNDRPLACRALQAFGPADLCRTDSPMQVSVGNASIAPPNDPVFVSNLLLAALSGRNTLVMFDIRQFFDNGALSETPP